MFYKNITLFLLISDIGTVWREADLKTRILICQAEDFLTHTHTGLKKERKWPLRLSFSLRTDGH